MSATREVIDYAEGDGRLARSIGAYKCDRERLHRRWSKGAHRIRATRDVGLSSSVISGRSMLRRPGHVLVPASISMTAYVEEQRAVAEARTRRMTDWATDVGNRMRLQKERDTAPELAVRRLLFRTGLRYRVHVRPLSGLRRAIDIAFPRRRVAVFVDGCFWHGCADHR